MTAIPAAIFMMMLAAIFTINGRQPFACRFFIGLLHGLASGSHGATAASACRFILMSLSYAYYNSDDGGDHYQQDYDVLPENV